MKEFCRFLRACPGSIDDSAISLRWVIPDLIRISEPIENTGCRIKSGMTTNQSPDFLRVHQQYSMFNVDVGRLTFGFDLFPGAKPSRTRLPIFCGVLY
jgi:hypothetical protein